MNVRCIECKHLKEKENSILLLTEKNGITELARFYSTKGNVKRSPIENGKILKCEIKGILRFNWNIYKDRKCPRFKDLHISCS